ncbi:hypothetical protein MRBBS_2507 [Marinobacter sp. BSs20148]|nr:hypothetical protein MRBBS_2507 [Marinobacter sp. BSs20148]
MSNDNPYIESLFGTTKQRPEYTPEGFESLELARDWVMKFITWYNEEHRHSAIRYVTPADRHEGKDADILARRKMTLLRAKEKNPGRWSTDVRNCEPIGPVWLNSLPEEQDVKEQYVAH